MMAAPPLHDTTAAAQKKGRVRVSTPRIPLKRLLGLSVLVVFTTQSCATSQWGACPQPCEGPALTKALSETELVRVHKTDGSVVELTAVSIGEDAQGRFLTGLPAPDKSGRKASTGKRVKIRFNDVSLLETRQPRVAGTFANLGIVAVVIGGVILIVAELAFKSSGFLCPAIESFDGRQYRLQSETLAGAFAPGLERTSLHKLDALVPVAGTYRVRLANNSYETDYFDQLALFAVEHPRGVTLAFLESSGKIATIREPLAPVAAYDGTGRDVLAALAARDGLNWESDVAALLAASRTIDELRLTFPKPAGASTAKLLLRAKNSRLGTRIRQDLVRLRGRDAGSWYADLAGSRRSARAFSTWLSDTWGWQVSVQSGGVPANLPLTDVGPIADEDLAFAFDVRGVTGDTLTLTLSGAAGAWQIDYAAVDYSPEVPLVWNRLTLLDARRALLDEPDGKRLALPSGGALDLVFSAAKPGPDMEFTPVFVTRGFFVPWLPDSQEPDRTVTTTWLRNPELVRRHFLEATP
jgi:hypothetical protein